MIRLWEWPEAVASSVDLRYVIEGRIEVVFTDGATETVKAGDVYYWPPGHSVSFPEDTTYVEFSPAKEMLAVLGHVKGKMGIS